MAITIARRRCIGSVNEKLMCVKILDAMSANHNIPVITVSFLAH